MQEAIIIWFYVAGALMSVTAIAEDLHRLKWWKIALAMLGWPAFFPFVFLLTFLEDARAHARRWGR